MECNRDEAVRAKEMAEQKFASKDYLAAKKFALKAQQLFPSLENLTQMIAVIDVHVAAQSKIGSDEKDWYGILQIEPTADDASVKKQYRKLALLFHPDKNKSIGAESAFKLIGEALQVLSDKVKRLMYDTKRGIQNRSSTAQVPNASTTTVTSNGQFGQCPRPPPPPPKQPPHQQKTQHHAKFQQNHHQQQPVPQFPGMNFNLNFAKFPPGQQQHCQTTTSSSTLPPQQHTISPQQQTIPPQQQTSATSNLFTFWTACTSCQMRYQYYRKYENQNLLCPQCRRPFIAKDLSNVLKVNVTQAWPPHVGQSNPAGSQAWHSTSSFGSTNFSSTGFNFFNSYSNGVRADLYQSFPGVATQQGSAARPPSSTVKSGVSANATSNIVDKGTKSESKEDLLRKIDEIRKARQIRKEMMKQAKAAEKAREAFARSIFMKEQLNKASAKLNKKGLKRSRNGSGSESEDDSEFWDKDNSKMYSSSISKPTDEEMNPFKKAKSEVDVGVAKQPQKSVDMAKRLADLAKNAIRMKLSHLQASKINATKPVEVECQGIKKDTVEVEVKTHPSEVKTEPEPEKNSDSVPEVPASCTVPDADFHNFDLGREEKDVEVGQIWALYDDKDGMPKYYVKVKEVRSRDPFKVVIGWFEPRKPSEEICKLLDMGFSLTCGEFRVSSSQVMDSVNSFSHLVKWDKAGKGIFKIYPKKGEIWAIYEDWEHGQQLVKICGDEPLKYFMVEVLTDCCDESGVTVILLQKVEGFKTIFQLSNEKILHIPFIEMLRFSHQVPAYKMQGDEAPGIPKGCWELDPAAVPMSLIDPTSCGDKIGTD